MKSFLSCRSLTTTEEKQRNVSFQIAGMVGSKFIAPFALRTGLLDLGVPDRDGDELFGDVLLLSRRSLFDLDLGDNRIFSSLLAAVAAAAAASISDRRSRVDDRRRPCCCGLLLGDTGNASETIGVEVAGSIGRSSSSLLDDVDESNCSSKISNCFALFSS